jgi:signal transduction histidine kinase
MNACQALKSIGGGIISVSAKSSDDSLQIAIGDNGPGIPRNQRKEIFEPFFTTKSEGTGLGLYITKQLVEHGGGKINFKSEEGSGAAFVLTFNRA